MKNDFDKDKVTQDVRKRRCRSPSSLAMRHYPTGKFNITYDYDKPEGYEETGDDVSVGVTLVAFRASSLVMKPKG